MWVSRCCLRSKAKTRTGYPFAKCRSHKATNKDQRGLLTAGSVSSSLSSLKPSSKLGKCVSVSRGPPWKTSDPDQTYSRLNLLCRSGLPLLLLLEASLSRRRRSSSSSGTSSSSSPSSELYPLSDSGLPATTRRSCSLSRQVEGTSHPANLFCIRCRSDCVPAEMVSRGRYAP